MKDEVPEVLGYITDKQGKKVELHRWPIRQSSLSPDQLRRVARLCDAFGDAYPITLDRWIDGFMRDANPESEIQIMEACVVVYQRLAARVSLSLEERSRLCSVLSSISLGAKGPEVASSLPADKGLPDLETIAEMYVEARRSGSRP